MSDLHIAGVNYESFVDGEGVRTTIYFSGCPHHCPGCHNPETWNSEYGKPVSDELLHEIAEEIQKRSFISGITLSGGDPFFHAEDVRLFVERLRSLIPIESIWIYTGYTWDEIKNEKLTELADVVVDGEFIRKEADKRLKFRGSRNQRLINVKESIEKDEVILWSAKRKTKN